MIRTQKSHGIKVTESMDEMTIYIIKCHDGTYMIGLTCPDCYCIIKRVGICHGCPDNFSYTNEQELQEHREFVSKIWHTCDNSSAQLELSKLTQLPGTDFD